MFLAHSFRLRSPWQCDCFLDGATRWARVFHRPTGLEPGDNLWLVCSGLPPEATVTLNGHELPASSRSPSDLQPPASRLQPHTYEVTALIADNNRLELLIPTNSAPPASSLQPPASPFPYDIRLGILADD